MAWGQPPYSIRVRGADEASFSPPLTGPVQEDSATYDVVVVGGGLAGLSASVYLSDQRYKVLLLEKESVLGGLAFGGALGSGVRYDRGAAYWTRAYEEEQKILEHIGLGDYESLDAIPDPIDSYLWKGRLYEGLWENEETAKALPSSFEVFKHELHQADEAKLIPNQPFEEFDKMDLDRLSAAAWVRSMPAKLARRRDAESRKLYRAFRRDRRVKRSDPMEDVIHLLDLYCRSALGGTADKVSAMAFANFYISEVETRYTTPIGTGTASTKMAEMLSQRNDVVTVKTQATVTGITNQADGATVAYNYDGSRRRAKAKFVVFAAQLKFAPRVIEGFAAAAPEQTRAIGAIDFTHYAVHAVQVQGHPYRATYDTWTRAANYTEDDFTDVINGRWVDPAVRGYEGMRNFEKDPADDQGILTIYQPMTARWLAQGFSVQDATRAAQASVDRMLELYNPMLAQTWGTKIEVKGVETNRWPFSIHVSSPGYFSRTVKKIRKPYGRVIFAHSNLGVPSFEEALFRGHCAANNIASRLNENFRQEAWTNCPLEN